MWRFGSKTGEISGTLPDLTNNKIGPTWWVECSRCRILGCLKKEVKHDPSEHSYSNNYDLYSLVNGYCFFSIFDLNVTFNGWLLMVTGFFLTNPSAETITRFTVFTRYYTAFFFPGRWNQNECRAHLSMVRTYLVSQKIRLLFIHNRNINPRHEWNQFFLIKISSSLPHNCKAWAERSLELMDNDNRCPHKYTQYHTQWNAGFIYWKVMLLQCLRCIFKMRH